MNHLRELLSARKPKSLRICALLNKVDARRQEVRMDHVGFDIPDEFVIGYGLDYNQDYRNLPFIGVLRG
jgi:hypoxanthine phosphoribosyltransferase